MQIKSVAGATMILALGLGGSIALAAPSFADETAASPNSYHIALWKGALNLQPKFPQTLVADLVTTSTDIHQLDSKALCSPEGPTTFQADLYEDSEKTDELLTADLTGAGEQWPGGTYKPEFSNVFTVPACAVTPPVAQPEPTVRTTALVGEPVCGVNADGTFPGGGTITTTTTEYSTPFVWDAETATYVAGEEVVSGEPLVTNEDAPLAVCPATVVVPPAEHPVTPPAPAAPVTPVTTVAHESLALTGTTPIQTGEFWAAAIALTIGVILATTGAVVAGRRQK